MKHYITALLLFFFTLSFSQNIDFEDILNIKTKNASEVKEFLLTKPLWT